MRTGGWRGKKDVDFFQAIQSPEYLVEAILGPFY